jgi:hypothetical protein
MPSAAKLPVMITSTCLWTTPTAGAVLDNVALLAGIEDAKPETR